MVRYSLASLFTAVAWFAVGLVLIRLSNDIEGAERALSRFIVCGASAGFFGGGVFEISRRPFLSAALGFAATLLLCVEARE